MAITTQTRRGGEGMCQRPSSSVEVLPVSMGTGRKLNVHVDVAAGASTEAECGDLTPYLHVCV